MPMTILLVRIDDGRRAKIQCTDCGGEAYVLLMPDGKPLPVEGVIEELETTREHKC